MPAGRGTVSGKCPGGKCRQNAADQKNFRSETGEHCKAQGSIKKALIKTLHILNDILWVKNIYTFPHVYVLYYTFVEVSQALIYG